MLLKQKEVEMQQDRKLNELILKVHGVERINIFLYLYLLNVIATTPVTKDSMTREKHS